MQYNPEITGKIIKSERKKLKLTQEGLGKKIPISGKQVSNYERGILFPPDSVLVKLCELFDCEKGYLLGEADYSNKTKLYTEIYNATGISKTSIDNILKITGEHKDSLGMGYIHDDYRRVLDAFLSSSLFPPFIEALLDLDRLYSQDAFQELLNEIGLDRLNKARENYNGPTDYLVDPNAPELPEEQMLDLKKWDASIDKEFKREYDIRVARYSVYEAFETLFSSLYPKGNSVIE